MPRITAFHRWTASLTLAALASACSTLGALMSSDHDGPAIYGGVYANARSMGREASEADVEGVAVMLIDFPFSLVADTLLLPVTIPMQLRAEPEPEPEPSASSPPGAAELSGVEGARAFVETCFALASEFDARFFDCYGSESIISYRGARSVDLSGDEFRDLLKRSLTLARARGDRSSFRDLRIEPEGSSFRVRATRHSDLYDYDSPWEALVGPDSTGVWRILRETIEVRR